MRIWIYMLFDWEFPHNLQLKYHSDMIYGDLMESGETALSSRLCLSTVCCLSSSGPTHQREAAAE